MAQKLITWPLLRTLGLYIGGCWVAVEFADWLVGRYGLPNRVVDVTLIGLLSFIPAVALIAHFHGPPGRQQFHPVEKIGIPANVLVSALIMAALLYGRPDETLAIETVTVTDPSGEAITRPLVEPSMSRGISLFFYDDRSGAEDAQWLQYGIMLALSADLQQHPFVKVWTPYQGLESYGMFQLRKAGYADGQDVPVALMRTIASAGRTEYFMSGRIEAGADGGYTLVSILYDTATARPVEQWQVEAAAGDGLFVAVDETTRAVFAALDLPETEEPPTDLPAAERLTGSPAAFEAHTRAMNALMLDGDSGQAITHWREAVEIDPGFAVAQVALGRTLLQSGQTLDGGLAVQAALKHDYKLIDRERFLAKGLNYVFRGQRDKELATYEAWTELAPDDPLAFTFLAQAYLYVANDPDRALAAFERIYELDPREDWVLAKIAYLHEIKHNREAAIEYYTRYHEARPESPAPLNSLGSLYRREGDLERARQFFERAAIVSSGLVDPVLNLADLDLRQGRYEQARERLEEAAQIATAPRQHAAVMTAKMRYHAQRGQQQQLLGMLPSLASVAAQYQAPIDVLMSVWVEHIHHYVIAGRIEEGVRILRDFEGRLQPPLNALVDIGYLRIALEMGDAEAASAHGETVVELMRTMSLDYLDYERAWSRGRISGIRGDVAAAIAHYEEALARFDASVNSVHHEKARHRIMTDLAEAYRRAGRPEQARRQLQGVLAVFPAHVPANLAMARLAHEQGRHGTAEEHLATVSTALENADENNPLLIAARDLGAAIGT